MTITDLIKDFEGLKVSNSVMQCYNELTKQLNLRFEEWSQFCTNNILAPTLELLRNHFEAEGNTISVLSNRKNNRPVLTFVYTKKDDYKPTGKVEFVFSENRRILIKEDMYSSKIHVPETKVCCLAEINYDLITTTIINFLTRIEENKTKNL